MPSRPFIPLANGAKLTAFYHQNGQPVENVFYFVGTSGWTAGTLASLASAFESWETAHARALRANSTAYHGCEVVDMSAQDSTAVSSSNEIDGTVNDTPLPNNCTIAIKASTGLAGRSNRGRTYWIGLVNGQRDGADHNAVNGTFAAAVVSAMNALISTAFPNSAVLVVASFRHDNAWRSSAVAHPVVSYALVDQTIDNQRRRLPGHNVHH